MLITMGTSPTMTKREKKMIERKEERKRETAREWEGRRGREDHA